MTKGRYRLQHMHISLKHRADISTEWVVQFDKVTQVGETPWIVLNINISIFLINTHTALDTFTMCLSIERFSSTITQRFVTMSVGVICVMLTFVLCFLSNHNEIFFFYYSTS